MHFKAIKVDKKRNSKKGFGALLSVGVMAMLLLSAVPVNAVEDKPTESYCKIKRIE